MADERTDRIAREAARLLETGRADRVADAVRAAADALGLDAPLPSTALVRRHVRGMAMQAKGESGYRLAVRGVWATAEELMATVEHTVEGARTLLAGRAARGHIDAGVTLHVRVYTDRPLREIVERLVEHGYDEPAFETADTRHGRLDRVRFVEAEQIVVLTRCPADDFHRAGHRDRDLFKDRPVETASIDDLRERLENPP